MGKKRLGFHIGRYIYKTFSGGGSVYARLVQ